MGKRFGSGRRLIGISLFLSLAGSLFVIGGFTSTEPAYAGASCASEPPSITGKITQTITVPENNTYTIWSRLKAPTAEPVEYQIYANNQCYTIGQTTLPAGELTWINHQDGAVNNKATIVLPAGQHTLVMTAGTDGLELDRVMLLSDSCVPTGTGDSCINDTTDPSVSLTSPASEASLTGPITLAATASDNDEIDYVEFYYGSTLIGSDATAPYSHIWDTTAVADGAYSLSAVTYDISGNSAASAAVAVSVINSPSVNASIENFTASPQTISEGQGTTLSWSVMTGGNCSIDNGVGAVSQSGTRPISPIATTTYSLSCDGENGGDSDTATVTVAVTPVAVDASISSFQASPSTITGG